MHYSKFFNIFSNVFHFCYIQKMTDSALKCLLKSSRFPLPKFLMFVSLGVKDNVCALHLSLAGIYVSRALHQKE